MPYTGQKTISAKWIFTEKLKNNKKIIKARLVARGYEEDTSNLRSDSPTCSREAMRLVLLTASIMNWQVQTLDFSSAFLQGDLLKREVFLRLPSDVCPKSQVWSLKRCIYGLNDAPRSWYKRVREVLIELKEIFSTLMTDQSHGTNGHRGCVRCLPRAARATVLAGLYLRPIILR